MNGNGNGHELYGKSKESLRNNSIHNEQEDQNQITIVNLIYFPIQSVARSLDLKFT